MAFPRAGFLAAHRLLAWLLGREGRLDWVWSAPSFGSPRLGSRVLGSLGFGIPTLGGPPFPPVEGI